MAKHNEIGALGEEIAANFLKKKGLKILQMNYWKPYGEIDIVARENDLIRFVEVKTVSYETDGKEDTSVSHGTYRPEENVHPQKIKRLSRVIESYIISHETEEWQFDVIAVYLDTKNKKAKVKWLRNVILGE